MALAGAFCEAGTGLNGISTQGAVPVARPAARTGCRRRVLDGATSPQPGHPALHPTHVIRVFRPESRGQPRFIGHDAAVEPNRVADHERDGASREKLAQIGRIAMSAWPAGKSGQSKLSGNGFSHGA